MYAEGDAPSRYSDDRDKSTLRTLSLLRRRSAQVERTRGWLCSDHFVNSYSDIYKFIGDRLFGNEHTINRGKDYTEYSIRLDTKRTDLPIAMAGYKLTSPGASSIVTISQLSSICGRFEIGKRALRNPDHDTMTLQ